MTYNPYTCNVQGYSAADLTKAAGAFHAGGYGSTEYDFADLMLLCRDNRAGNQYILDEQGADFEITDEIDQTAMRFVIDAIKRLEADEAADAE